MAASFYGYEGQQGYTPVSSAISRRFGDTPGGNGQGAGMFSFQGNNGQTQYFLPERYMAGNAWSSATPNADYIRSIGGREFTTPTGSTTTRNTSNPWGQNYNEDVTKNWGGQKGWIFDSLPDWAGIENNSTFLAGRGDSNAFQNKSLLALAAAAAGGAALGGGAGAGASGSMVPVSGGGTLSSSAAMPGSALGASGSGGGVLAGSIPSMSTVPTMAGSGVGAFGGAGTLSGAGAAGAGAAGTAGGLSSLGTMLSNGASSVGNWLTSPAGVYAGLGAADMYLRNQQQDRLEEIMNEAANRADAFQQPQRIPYQGLLARYLQDGESIANQPYVRANMDFALDQARANLARTGRSGSGGAERELVDYTNQVFEANALPYLNQLSGMAGFGFGPGASGQLYGQYGAMASGMPSIGLSELARGFGMGQPTIQPWQLAAYNAQQQMMGRGEGRNWTLS